MSNFHLQEIQTLQNSLREREEYITELQTRLRALWDKYDGDSKHYREKIKRLEEAGDEIIWVFCKASVSIRNDRESEALKLWIKARGVKL